jgi:hypothetical protein
MMKARKFFPLSLMMIVATLLLAACSSTSTTGSSTPSKYTASQVISKSSDAMSKLNSSHFVVQMTENIQAAGNGATTSNGQSVKSPSGTPLATNTSSQMNGTGDQKGNDFQYSYTLNAPPVSVKMAEVVQGNNVYIQNQNGQWYVISKDKLANNANSLTGNSLSGLSLDQKSLLGVIQDVKLTDHGDENVNGQSLRHLTASLDKQALSQLLSQNAQLKSQFGQQNIDNVLNAAKTFSANVDVFIDETQFYVHRTQLAIDLTVDTSKLPNVNGGASNVSLGLAHTKLNMNVDLSKFNQPVTLNVPTNATPTSDPAVIFGLNGQKGTTTTP